MALDGSRRFAMSGLAVFIVALVLGVGTAPAARVAETVPVGTTTTTLDASGRCAQWEGLALDAGWTLDQWPTVDRIMWCESKCEPWAHNRSGASGLMQVMPMWWHGRDPFDPATNLAMALEIRQAQGWRAWSCY
jgi:hypothetical protein